MDGDGKIDGGGVMETREGDDGDIADVVGRAHRRDVKPDEVHPGDVSVGDVRVRALVRRVALIALVPTLAIACSLPVDERANPLDDDDVPADLAQPTTTTSTTTTSTTTTIADPESTVDRTSTTTLAPVATEPVRVFYTLGFTNDLVPIQLEVPSPVPIEILVDLLESPSGLETVPNVRTSVRQGLIEVDEIVIERGTATIPLDPDVVSRLSDQAVERAVAQIVLTFTSFVTVDQGGIAFVLFEVEGEGFPVFVPAGGGSSEPGEPLTFSDFSELILTTPAATTVDTPTVATPTVAPTVTPTVAPTTSPTSTTSPPST